MPFVTQGLRPAPSTIDGMDAINSLLAGQRRAQGVVDAAAQQIARADLPTTADKDPAQSATPDAGTVGDVDVADQLVTMTVGADLHHVTTAALRSALSLYQDSLDLLRP